MATAAELLAEIDRRRLTAWTHRSPAAPRTELPTVKTESQLLLEEIRRRQEAGRLAGALPEERTLSPVAGLAPGAPPPVPSNRPSYFTPEGALRQGSADAFGGPLSSFDPANTLPPSARAALGALSNTDANERKAALEYMYPGAKIAPVGPDMFGVQMEPNGPVMYTNREGMDRGDLAEFGAGEGPKIGWALLGGAFGGPVGAAAGVAAGGALQEGIQKAFGTQREGLGDFAGRTAIESGMELLPVVGKAAGKAVWDGTKWVARKALGRTLDPVQQFMGDLNGNQLQAAIAAVNRDENLGLPPLMVFQKSKDPVVQAVFKQAKQYSQEAQDRISAQMGGLAEAARTRAIPKPDTLSTPDEMVQQRMAERYREVMGQVPELNPLGAGVALGDAVEGQLKAEKAAMSQGYTDLFGYLEQNPNRFNLGKAQAAARERVVPGELSEKDIFEQLGAAVRPDGSVDLDKIRGFINVNSPNEKLSRINSVLQRLNPEQDFQVVKELRTQVGKLRDLPLSQKLQGDFNQAQIASVYGDLSDAMMNPVSPDKAFTDLAKKVNAQAKTYYGNYDDAQILRVLDAKQGSTQNILFDQFTQNPPQVTGSLMKKLDASPAHKATFVDGLDAAIMRSDDPLVALTDWEKRSPEAYRWMFPTPKNRADAQFNARKLKALQEGVSREAFDAAETQVGFAKKAIQEYGSRETGPHAAGRAADRYKPLVAQMGGEGSSGHRALRNSVMEDIILPAIRENSKGVQGLNPDTLVEAMKAAEKDGLLKGILNERDRKVLDTLLPYARKTWKSGDLGAGLAVASGMGKLRRGDVTELTHNATARWMASALTNEAVDLDALLRPLGGAGRVSRAMDNRAVGLAAAAMRQGWMAPAVAEDLGVSKPELGPDPTLPPRIKLESPPGWPR